MRDTEREREKQRPRQREKQAPYREPDVGLNPGTPGSRLGLKAVLTHWATPGCPAIRFSIPSGGQLETERWKEAHH